jgi:hypothetical protein
MKNSVVKPISYLLISLIIFSLLGLEFLVFFFSRLVDGRAASQVFSWPVNWYGAIFHWTVTIILWAAGAWMIYAWAKRKGVRSDVFRVNINQRDVVLLAIGVAFVIVYELVYSRLTGLRIPQIWREYQGFQSMYGSQAWIVSLFQNLYYLMEFVMVVLMIAFFQRAGELWSKLSWFPWGGIGLGLTWGMIHLVTNPQGAVWVIVFGVMLGIFFVLSRKSFLVAWILGVLAFIL